DLRDTVLDVALQEFGRRGYAAASLEEILRAADVSERVFRAHFVDKPGLAVAVLEREHARRVGILTALHAATKDEFWSEMRAPPRMDEPGAADLARLALSAYRHPEVVARLEPHNKRWREKLASVLHRGQELRAVRTDLPMGVLITIAQGLKRAAIA